MLKKSLNKIHTFVLLESSPVLKNWLRRNQSKPSSSGDASPPRAPPSPIRLAYNDAGEVAAIYYNGVLHPIGVKVVTGETLVVLSELFCFNLQIDK